MAIALCLEKIYLQMAETFSISEDKSKLDIEAIFDFLSNRSYWAKGRTKETIQTAIDNSLCFGLYENDTKMVGFARVVTDCATFGYIMDLFVLEGYRCKGLGKLLTQHIKEHPKIKSIRFLLLATRTAHEFYHQQGFEVLEEPERFMRIMNQERS